MAKSADARDLKSLGSDTVPVQVRSAAPYRNIPRQSRGIFLYGAKAFTHVALRHTWKLFFCIIFPLQSLRPQRKNRAWLIFSYWEVFAFEHKKFPIKKLSGIILIVFFQAVQKKHMFTSARVFVQNRLLTHRASYERLSSLLSAIRWYEKIFIFIDTALLSVTSAVAQIY